MIEEFRSSGLVAAAQKLGVNPFELVRLSVALDEPSADLRFSSEAIQAIGSKAGIQALWSEHSLPQASSPIEAAVRGAAGLLLELGYVGNTTVRLDNLSRGLTPEQAEAVDESAALLAEEGVLLLMSSPAGLQVSVAPGHEGTLRALADGSSTPDGIRALWTE